MRQFADVPIQTLHECPDCGLVQTLPELGESAQATCVRCNATLRRTSKKSHDRALALVATSFILYLIAMLSPFLSVDIVGRHTDTTVISLPAAYIENGAWELGVLVLLTVVVAPLVKICVLLAVLIGLRTANPPASLPLIFKWYRRVGPWAMIEVFLLGVFVAFTRLGAIARVDTGVGLYAVAGLMVTIVAADYVIDPDAVWQRMAERGLVPPPDQEEDNAGELIGCETCGRTNQSVTGARCSCCGSMLFNRKPNSILNTWALLVSGALLYIPANIYPVLTTTRLGASTPSTIIGGAKELLDAGMWPLALLVFVASIMVPMLKLVSLVVMLVTTQRGSSWRLRDRTRLYRVVDAIGRWSMIDIFMLSTLVGLVQAGMIADIKPGLGAICFGAVVVLTMFAASCFDPRLMWDAAGNHANETEISLTGTAEPNAA